MNSSATTTDILEHCYHCGDECKSDRIALDDKVFCCTGCKTVFEILSQSELCDYYTLENQPGIQMKAQKKARFDYLENEEIIDKLLDYQDENIGKVQFYLPQIHCSACLWLLENLYKLHPGVENSRVHFLKKEIYVTFLKEKITLKELVELLSSIGYEPNISQDNISPSPKQKPISKRLIYQLGLAGFAFGNIMLLSLPEYFGLDVASYREFSPWFGWINLLLATPVAIFSGQDYFKSAGKSIRQKRLNIDVPIALGVFVLFFRSVFEIISKTGPGYFDSLCGLLFFLLLGRIFQEKVYHQLSFERDYRSYFPIAVSRLQNNTEESIPIQELSKGDKILIRNGELIPVDAYLIKGEASIDNSFATGESEPVKRKVGEKIYAGGRQVGEAIQLEVIRPLNQSKLTRLWSEYAAKEKKEATFSDMTDKISEWFTPIILLIAITAGFFHLDNGWGKVFEVVSAVLIVACPCALALAAPFTFGHATRWLGRNNCYLREANVIEEMANVQSLVFDKTGTLTYGSKQKVLYKGRKLSSHEQEAIWNLVNQSTHPLSRLIKESLPPGPVKAITHFKEFEGKGIEGIYANNLYRMGSHSWLSSAKPEKSVTQVVLEIDQEVVGSFEIESAYRPGLKTLLKRLHATYQLSMLSGDNDHQKKELEAFFTSGELLFQQSPQEKLQYIQSLQEKGQKVMMIGDGLNDAGALKQSNVGMVVAEDINAFSPACDVILGANEFSQLDLFLSFSKRCKRIVILSFIISFLYNSLGLAFAVQGALSPVFAAILMPVSSVSVVGFVSLSVWFYARHLNASKTP
jgi:Cu+-exporting ATPase